jgi:CRP-like cAMP-binding protein
MADVYNSEYESALYRQNQLLAGLTRDERNRLLPKLKPVNLKFADVLYGSGSPINEVYFPANAVVSTVTVIGELRVETSLIGNEGVVGVPVFLGVSEAANESVVQSSGAALAVRAADVLEEFRRMGSLHDAVLRYTHVLLAQVAQTANCNRHHSLEERLSRWLLMMRDRVESNTLALTQEFLSWMLGVRDLSASAAASNLQDAGIIEYDTGRIVILDPKKLETTACGCHRLLKAHFNRLLAA